MKWLGLQRMLLGGIVDITKPGAPSIPLPPFKYVAEVSLKVATAVAKKLKNNLARVAEQDMEKSRSWFQMDTKY